MHRLKPGNAPPEGITVINHRGGFFISPSWFYDFTAVVSSAHRGGRRPASLRTGRPVPQGRGLGGTERGAGRQRPAAASRGKNAAGMSFLRESLVYAEGLHYLRGLNGLLVRITRQL